MDTAYSAHMASSPDRAGISLKAQHYTDVLESRPSVGFFEVHAENYMVDGGPHHHFLSEIRQHYPLSVHGVGMSLGSAEGLDMDHVHRFRTIVETYDPFVVSDHLAWSRTGDTYLNDLLPVPLTHEALAVVVDNIKTLQDALSRQILVENPSSYLGFTHSEMGEADFLAEMAERADCGLLLDANNVFVSARNFGFDATRYIDTLPLNRVGEIHLAGHLTRDIDGVELRIDDHGHPVPDDVWALYADIVGKAGFRPTLVEWDTNIPPLDDLVAEAHKADAVMSREREALNA